MEADVVFPRFAFFIQVTPGGHGSVRAVPRGVSAHTEERPPRSSYFSCAPLGINRREVYANRFEATQVDFGQRKVDVDRRID